MAVGVVGAAIAGTDCGASVQPLYGASIPVDAASDATSARDAGDASDAQGDANDGEAGDATDDWPGPIALYGAPPPPPDPGRGGGFEPDAG
jgi:hypothetical protein